MGEREMIRTSQPGWLGNLAIAYKNKRPVTLVDDANAGINPEIETLLGMGQRAGLSSGDWGRVLGCLGVSGIGITIIVLAILDPEPTSKLFLLVGGGLALAVGGGGAAIYVLTGIKPPTVVINGPGFDISWGT